MAWRGRDRDWLCHGEGGIETGYVMERDRGWLCDGEGKIETGYVMEREG